MSENWGGGVKGSSCSGPTVEDYYAMAEREGRSSGPQTYSQISSSSSHQPTYRSGWNFERLFHHQQQPTLPHSHSIALRLSLASLWSIVTSTALEKSSSQIRYTNRSLHPYSILFTLSIILYICIPIPLRLVIFITVFSAVLVRFRK
ncbi:hypothetical protein PSTT_15941 [Puccinia striiformis]|uniref:Transmembrane protein n=1 Tax=Puccinia striiformis TaxID=27350 RepID=A0A2S4UF90_9BASI|nr:hypothetical protein PSTT_15941 [Puccinia striiformis]